MSISKINIFMIVVLIALHILDATGTMYLVYGGHAREINPLMKFCLQIGPLAFVFAKFFGASIHTLFFLAMNETQEILTSLMILYIISIYVEEAINQYTIFSSI